jgi:hypothetical protein
VAFDLAFRRGRRTGDCGEAGALAAAVALGATVACAPPPDVLLPDQGAPIRLALAAVASPARSGLRNQALVETLAARLGPRTHLLILAEPEMVLEPNPWPERVSFVPVPSGLDFSIWPQDPFVVVRGAGGSRLLAARGYGRAQDREMARVVGAFLGWPVVESSLFFSGGNLLSDGRHVFVGESLILENARDLGLAREAVLARFADELGLPPLVVAQAVEHIDMVLTPLGEGRVALADAAAGATLAERMLAEQPERVLEFERMAERWFFGDPAVASVLDGEGESVAPPRVAGELPGAIADTRAIVPLLERAREELERRGYRVVRLPFLAARPVDLRTPTYPMLSYNNVLLERLDGRDRVYVAEYGLEALDREARRAWEAAGFAVHAIPNVTTSAMYRGSVRCCVKVLEREAPRPER